MNDSGVLGIHVCPYSTSAIVVTVRSSHLPSVWTAELQTEQEEEKPKSFETGMGLGGIWDIMCVNID